MIDSDMVDELRAMLVDRFTPEDLCEILGITVEDLFERFNEEVLRTDWGEYV